MMTEYQKKLEEFRTHYRNEYQINFDDEILYFFIRVNEMQKDIKKDIRKMPKVTFRTGWDYFLYGLGKWLIPSVLIVAAAFIIFPLSSASSKTPENNMTVITKEGQPYLEIKTDSSIYYIPFKKK